MTRKRVIPNSYTNSLNTNEMEIVQPPGLLTAADGPGVDNPLRDSEGSSRLLWIQDFPFLGRLFALPCFPTCKHTFQLESWDEETNELCESEPVWPSGKAVGW